MKKKIIGGIALGLLGIFSLASCNLTITDNTKNQDQTDSGSDSDTKTETFTITFDSKGGSSVTSQTVKKGNKATKPADPTRSGYTFAGWYKEEAYTNEFNFETTTITYDRTLYAKWTQNSSGGGESTTKYIVTFDVNGHGTAPANQTISKGGIVTKPTDPSATGYTFGGWYKEASCTNAWNFTTDTVNGATTLYAKWTQITTNDVITKYSSYTEGAYVEFKVASASAASNSIVSYSSNGSNWTNIDSELIRYNNSTKKARADILGLKAGNYYIKVNNTEKVEVTPVLAISADDRSGYAHFNYTNGIGAYKDDGTLKSTAKVIYVTEESKNNVDEDRDGVGDGKSLTDVIKNASSPLDIRIIGRIGAATWNTPTYPTSAYSTATTETIRGNNGSYLSLKEYDETALLKGYNTLNETIYPKLNGLTNKIKYDSSKEEFDSYYNMMDISGKSNITVEGVGVDAEIFQWGFTWKSCNSIEVKNLTFTDYPEDACSFEGSNAKLSSSSTTEYNVTSLTEGRIWLHNNTFNLGKNYWDVCSEHDKGDGDGSTDIKYTRNLTVSYNKYSGTHKTGLVGGSENQLSACITFHHNWYAGCKSRLPYARQANMHMYNNFYDCSTGTTMQIYAGAYAFIENCYFKNDNKTFDINAKGYATPAVKSYNNIFNGSKNYNVSGVTLAQDRTSTASNGNIFYYQVGTTKHKYSSFDTNSSLFYYDSVNQKSNVSIMNDASDLPTLIPSVAGAGLCAKLTYSN